MNQIKEQPFLCHRASMQIRGMQFMSDQTGVEKKLPIIIISHGFSGSYLDGFSFARYFAGRGYAAFCFSFCGGTSLEAPASSKSEGDTKDMTIASEIADLMAVKDYAGGLTNTDEKRITLLGFSQGGLVSGLCAAKCAEEIEKLIMIFPALCIPDHARRGCLAGSSYNPSCVPEVIDCGNMVLGRAFHEGVVTMDPYLELQHFKGPVLILHGMEDTIVDYSYSIRAKACYSKELCQLQLIRDMGHGMNEAQEESVLASIMHFLQGYTGILTIRIILTHVEKHFEENLLKQDVYFTGYCDNDLFHGAVTPEGVDRQEYLDGNPTKICADYTLLGKDAAGETCRLHIINQRKGEQWVPIIETDSRELIWLNRAELTAVLEFNQEGPVVRIYHKK